MSKEYIQSVGRRAAGLGLMMVGAGLVYAGETGIGQPSAGAYVDQIYQSPIGIDAGDRAIPLPALTQRTANRFLIDGSGVVAAVTGIALMVPVGRRPKPRA